MSDANREARIQELRKLIEQGNYQIDSQLTAARLVDEHFSEPMKPAEDTLSVAASVPSSTALPK